MSVMMTCVKHTLEIEVQRPNPIVCGHCQRELILKEHQALLERCEKMEKALKRAADMIESDFCSHGTPHGDVSACFANFIYAALASKEKPSV